MKEINKFKEKVIDWSQEFLEMEEEENMRLNHRFDYGDKTLIVSFVIINRATEWTRGVFNRTRDGFYSWFLDFDYLKLEYIKGEVEHLQLVKGLGNAHFFKSSNKGVHVVGFEKLTAREYMELLDNSSVDQAFKYTPRMVSYRNWVLRNFSKGNKKRPEYIFTLKGKTKRQQSTAHHKYFSLLYPEIKKFRLTNPDNIQKVRIVDYPTGKNV